jgi:hypothetical protein
MNYQRFDPVLTQADKDGLPRRQAGTGYMERVCGWSPAVPRQMFRDILLSDGRSRQMWASLRRATGIAVVVVFSAVIPASGEAAAGSPDGTYFFESDTGGKAAEVQGITRPNSTPGEHRLLIGLTGTEPTFSVPVMATAASRCRAAGKSLLRWTGSC